MTVTKEFQQRLQNGQIAKAVSLVISQLVELDVTTDLAATSSAPPSSLRTQISLLTGKITTEVHPELLSRDSAQQLLDFHTAQITATHTVVREHLQSLRDLLQILGKVQPTTTIADVVNPTLPMVEKPSSPAAKPTTVSEIPPPPPPPEILLEQSAQFSRSNSVSSAESADVQGSPAATDQMLRSAAGMLAAVAQAGSPKLEEANTIPNKFDQVLKSAGVKEKEDAANNPFLADLTVATAVTQPVAGSGQTFPGLEESDREWDEWLLEEDAILSELSQASQEVARDKIPDWDEQQFSYSPQPKSVVEDWESFIPEYVDLDAPTYQGNTNVERFRQNLVNDPQLMSELLAELDDIEQSNQDGFSNPSKS